MMRAVSIAGLLLVTASILTSPGCTVYSSRGNRIAAERFERRVVLTGGNFRIVRSHVEGTASCRHLLFLPFPDWAQGNYGLPRAIGIPLDSPALLEAAMADLHSRIDMEGRPTVLQDLSQEWTFVTYLGLFGTAEVKVSCEVLEFVGEAEDAGVKGGGS
jgi:hypothetical protein